LIQAPPPPKVARQLKARKIQPVTIITNALNIASELMDASGISVIVIGGLLRPVSCSFVGPQSEMNAQGISRRPTISLRLTASI